MCFLSERRRIQSKWQFSEISGQIHIAQSAGAVEYTDCTSAEG